MKTFTQWLEEAAPSMKRPSITHVLTDDNESPENKIQALNRHSVTSDDLHTALNGHDRTVKLAVLRQHPKVESDHLHTALNDPHPLVRFAAINHPSVDATHNAKGLADPHPAIRAAAMAHHTVTKDQATAGLDSSNHQIVRDAAKKKLSEF